MAFLAYLLLSDFLFKPSVSCSTTEEQQQFATEVYFNTVLYCIVHLNLYSAVSAVVIQ